MKQVFTSMLFILAFSLSAFAQTKHDTAKRVEDTQKQLAPIKSYVKSVTDHVNKVEFPNMVVADVSDYNTATKPEWRKFDSQKAFEEANVESYETYFIWKKDGKVVQVNVTYSSPSGDWAQYVFHTYYPNGKAAKIDRELRTFMGDVIVNRISWYDKTGKLVKKSETYRDLQTQKPIKKPEGFMDIEADVYERVGKLPFRMKK